MNDVELLKIYRKGFSDELWGKTTESPTDELALRAYEIGSLDTIIGDDLTSCDSQTDKEILKRIKHKENELD